MRKKMRKKISKRMNKRKSRRMNKRKSRRMNKRKSRRMSRRLRGGSAYTQPAIPVRTFSDSDKQLTSDDFCPIGVEGAKKILLETEQGNDSRNVHPLGTFMLVKEQNDTKYSLIELTSFIQNETFTIINLDLNGEYFPLITYNSVNYGKLFDLLIKIKRKNPSMKLTNLLGKEYCNLSEALYESPEPIKRP